MTAEPLPIATFRAEIEAELSKHATEYLDRQIAWRRDLIARYQAEIDEILSNKVRRLRSIGLVVSDPPNPAVVAKRIGRVKRKTG